MKNMEKEPKIEKSLEERLREKGYQIERAQLSEDDFSQCDECMSEDNDFQFHQEGWFIEGDEGVRTKVSGTFVQRRYLTPSSDSAFHVRILFSHRDSIGLRIARYIPLNATTCR